LITLVNKINNSINKGLFFPRRRLHIRETMTPHRHLIAFAFSLVCASAQTIELPSLAVHSTRVANQEPTGTFTMPVTALRFEPRVDVQARNLAEGQADIAIRGGTFENTGFKIGSLPLYDPQTGHYFAEIPLAASFLTAPEVLTGVAHASGGWNATAGSIAYGLQPVRTGGVMTVSAGENASYRGEVHTGYLSPTRLAGRAVGFDVAAAHSVSDGTIPLGDHEFSRANARLQLRNETSQTDLLVGYQSKFFGWPNLYTPFNSPESENLQTLLVAGHHRVTFGADGGFFQTGVYYRRNKDDYDFNRFTEAGKDGLFQHTTWVYGLGLDGRAPVSETVALGYRAGVVTDRLQSTSLTFGRYRSRTHVSAALYPEWHFARDARRTWTLIAGATFDDTNRDSSALSPLVEFSRSSPQSPLTRFHFGYARTTQVATYTALNSAANAGLFRGNPDLGRSSSHQFEAGVEGRWAGWEMETAIFARRDDRLVDWTFRRGVTARTANPVDIDNLGVEFFARRSWGRIALALGYAWLHKDADYGSSTVDASFYALNFPEHRLTAAIVAPLGRGFELRVDNELRRQEENFLRVQGGDSAVLTAVGLYWRAPGVRGLTLSAQLDNAWDSDFQEVPAVPASRRQAAVGLTYQW